MDDQLVEKVAKAIASENGDDLDEVPQHKSDWNARRGQSAGRFRDINEPFKSDYEDMAKAAIQATGVLEMREALAELCKAFIKRHGSYPVDAGTSDEEFWCLAMARATQCLTSTQKEQDNAA